MSDLPEFPSPVAIAVAHNLMGFDRFAPDAPPVCDRCGAPVETGMIALFCPFKERCKFHPLEGFPKWMKP